MSTYFDMCDSILGPRPMLFGRKVWDKASIAVHRLLRIQDDMTQKTGEDFAYRSELLKKLAVANAKLAAASAALEDK